MNRMNDVTNHQPNCKSIIYTLWRCLSIIKFIHIYYWSTDNMVIEKDESKLVDRAGKNYLNYTISYIIWSIVLVVITLIGVFLIARDINFISLIIIGFIITFYRYFIHIRFLHYLLYSQLLRVSH